MNTKKKDKNTIFEKSITIENGFYLLITKRENSKINFQNSNDTNETYFQIHFCVKGSVLLKDQNNSSRTLNNGKSICVLYSGSEAPFSFAPNSDSIIISILLTIKKLKLLFASGKDLTSLLLNSANEYYYKEFSTSSSCTLAMFQVLTEKSKNTIKELFIKAKAYEILSLFIHNTEVSNQKNNSPQLSQKDILNIKQAHDIIITRICEPPTLIELSNEVSLPLKKLKIGFKAIYGTTIYNFALNYKMKIACKLLISKKHSVSEIGLDIGYSTASHFIAAFKKKFGTTPKKYVMNLS
ncbi:helix-turn-helix domain-containing protein [Aquimarina latercula]|uniref:helix-turn-helix domain-containing protein n=1 Tax=Aquimarina latercula TaxID=987 RepID=UPI00040FFCA8|nr:AraC family transcriptional regulator [Aquimarina latercula]